MCRINTRIKPFPPGSTRASNLLHQVIFDSQHIHLRPQEAFNSFLRSAHHGLIFIERSIEHDGDTGQFLELPDKLPVAQILVSIHRLQSSRPVHVRRGRYFVSLLRLDPVGHQHKRRWIGMLEIVAHSLFQNGRRKRPERLAVLDAAIQYVLHLRPSWINYNTPVAQSAWPEFHPSLIPPDDLSLRNSASRHSD